MIQKIGALLLFSCLSVQLVFGKIALPAILGNNMVLQQKSNANLWGKGNASTQIEVITSWDKKKYNTTSSPDGRWKLSVKTPSAGGPFTISISDGETLLLENVMVGEVWVCSGQSNMAMQMKGSPNQPILNSKELIDGSSNNNLRLFTVKRDTASNPKDDCVGNWNVSSPENVADFSAIAFQYGQQLQKKLGVPVGMIVSSWGGTPIRAWMGESLNEFPTMNKEDKKPNHRSPHVLYHAMIAPLTPFSIKGFLWYQGEGDVNNHEIYAQMMVAMVKEWRTAWKQPDAPFYYVQIAPWLYTKDKVIAPYLREAQVLANKLIPNSAMVVTADIGSNKTIHPPDKTTIANRLINCALATAYKNKNVAFEGPSYKSLKVKDGKALLRFDNKASELVLKSDGSENFEIAGEDKVFYPAKAMITSKGIEVYSDKVQQPAAVRYAFKNYMVGDLFNKNGLPASPFRTDNWK